MQVADGLTATEAALEDDGIHPSKRYALRADQLEDGTYRYALECPETGRTLAEGVDSNPDRAIRTFEQNLQRSGLTEDEIRDLIRNIDRYEEG